MEARPRIDGAFIAEVKARTDLRAVIGRDVALIRRGRDWWGCCPFHGEKTPSFKVDGSGRFWKCFGTCGRRGDAVGWLDQYHHMGFAEAIEELAIAAGLQPDPAGGARGRPLRQPHPRGPDDSARLERDRREIDSRVAWARALWETCRPAAGTPVVDYLRGRGIALDAPPTIRFHPALKHKDTGRLLPAMVAAIQSPAGKIVGVHRTFIEARGRDAASLGLTRGQPIAPVVKADVPSPRKIAGIMNGCAIRLAPAGRVMVSGEGIETTLSVMQQTGLPGWAAISLGNMAGAGLGKGGWSIARPGQRRPSETPDPGRPGLMPPPQCTEWVWLADNDFKDFDQGRAMMARAGRKLDAWRGRAEGRSVRIAWPPKGADFNDLLTDRGEGGDASPRGKQSGQQQ